jgi:hypothetical protein
MTLPGCPRSAGEPRAPCLVVDQGMNIMEVEGDKKRGKKSRLICLYVDWIDGNSIGHDPLLYIEGWSYPSRKPLQGLFSKFPTSKNRSRDKSVQNLKVRFGINTYRYFRSDSTGSTDPHWKFWSWTGSTGSSFSRKIAPSSASHRKLRSRTGSTGGLFSRQLVSDRK